MPGENAAILPREGRSGEVASSRDGSGVALAHSITRLGEGHRGRVVVSGSHGGVYAGYCAAEGGVRAVILNDAGIGRDRAGIGSLAYLDGMGLAAATADAATCRIGDAADTLERGVVSHCNAAARAVGCRPGQSVREAARLLAASAVPTAPVAPVAESRFVIRAGPGPAIVGIDSASLFRPEDRGTIVVTASHGARVGGAPDRSAPEGVVLATYHDAGGGPDGRGTTRLPDLDARGVAAATVSAESARIGDARSCYENGIVSRLNVRAEALGGRVGMRLRDLVDLAAAREASR